MSRLLTAKHTDNVIVNLSIQLSLAIIKYCEVLENEKKYVIANQLLKSGTSIGANIFEAQNAESQQDFYHKMKIAAKEAEETEYWLILCSESASYPNDDEVVEKLISVRKVLSKILSSTKSSLNNK